MKLKPIEPSTKQITLRLPVKLLVEIEKQAEKVGIKNAQQAILQVLEREFK